MVTHVEARSGAYADSVTLMQVSSRVNAADGVEAALIAMGTPLNLDLARSMGFDAPEGAAADDLLVAIRARDEAALAAALAVAADALAARPAPASAAPGMAPPRTVGSAARGQSGQSGQAVTRLALISVPGRHAFAEAMDALDAGVRRDGLLRQRAGRAGGRAQGRGGRPWPARDGPRLRHRGRRRPRPRVRQLVAPGSGRHRRRIGHRRQQVLCLLDAAGVGVTAALGVGGRDLSSAVGGRSTLAAIHCLDADPATN